MTPICDLCGLPSPQRHFSRSDCIVALKAALATSKSRVTYLDECIESLLERAESAEYDAAYWWKKHQVLVYGELPYPGTPNISEYLHVMEAKDAKIANLEQQLASQNAWQNQM